MLGAGIRDEYRNRLEALEVSVNSASESLKRMASVVIITMLAIVVILAAKG